MQLTNNVRAVQVPDDNPSHPMFTTIYLVGKGQVLSIDSGEDMERYRWMLKGYLAATEKAEISVSAVTHHHADHSANLRWLRNEFQTEIYLAEEGVPLMQNQLPETGVNILNEASVLKIGGGVNLTMIRTPGHSVDSLSYLLEDEGVLFSGDTILGGSSTTVYDLADYMESLKYLCSLPNLKYIAPGHGPIIENPVPYMQDYIKHREEREAQVVAALQSGPKTSWEIMESIYTDINPRLRRSADGQVRTHLKKLEKEGRIEYTPGKRRERSAEEVEKAQQEEHERLDLIRRANEYREQDRRRALNAQENPTMDEWEDPPHFWLA